MEDVATMLTEEQVEDLMLKAVCLEVKLVC